MKKGQKVVEIDDDVHEYIMREKQRTHLPVYVIASDHIRTEARRRGLFFPSPDKKKERAV